MRTPLIAAAAAALLLLTGCSSASTTTEVSEISTPTITEPAAEATPDGPTPEEYAAQFDAALLEALGRSSYQDICATDATLWGCYVSEIKPHTVGGPEIVLQGYPGPMTPKEIATAAMSLTCESLPDLSSVTVSEATTGDIDLAARYDAPLCA